MQVDKKLQSEPGAESHHSPPSYAPSYSDLGTANGGLHTRDLSDRPDVRALCWPACRESLQAVSQHAGVQQLLSAHRLRVLHCRFCATASCTLLPPATTLPAEQACKLSASMCGCSSCWSAHRLCVLHRLCVTAPCTQLPPAMTLPGQTGVCVPQTLNTGSTLGGARDSVAPSFALLASGGAGQQGLELLQRRWCAHPHSEGASDRLYSSMQVA